MTNEQKAHEAAKLLALGLLNKSEKAAAVHAWALACKAILAGHR